MNAAPVSLNARLSALVALGDRLDAADTATAPGEALRAVVPELGLQAGWVFLTDTVLGDVRSGTLSLADGFGLPSALAHDDASALRCGGCECQRRFRDGALAHGVNMVRCSRLAAAAGRTDGLELHASVPVRGRAGPFGILNLAAPGERRFTEDELAFLDVVGRQLGAALERGRLAEARTEATRFGAALEERHRLARELHDALSQLLFASTLQLRLAREEGGDAEPIARAESLLSDARGELRALVETSRSPDLSAGLVPALARLADRMAPSVTVHLDAAPARPSAEVAEALYRVTQEAVHNAVRHGDAQHLRIALERSVADSLRLSVQDDGRGCDPQVATRGPGLRGASERIASLGGTLQVDRSDAGGLRIVVEIPSSARWSDEDAS
ncbi:MAG: GAF domain-containing sensor histidine kinase [Trueperaceae bacterium]|nr:GAF domain-containing sensor histidine kinase [Trueperaceae bacterium]